MSEEKIINNSQENLKEKIEPKINLTNFNNYWNLQDNNISQLNIDKDQLFQSFILFQNFLSMNPNLLKDNKNIEKFKIEEKDIKTIESVTKANKLNESKILNDSKNNNEEEMKIQEENKSTQAENKLIDDINEKEIINEKENKYENKNANINVYDEIPIKPAGYNFVELLEKTLANEENNKNENEKKNNNRKTKIKHFNKKIKNINNITKDTSSSMYNNMSEPNISKENKYFKMKETFENKSFDKNEEVISSINDEILNENNNIKTFKKCILLNENKIKEEYCNIIKEDELKDISPKTNNEFSQNIKLKINELTNKKETMKTNIKKNNINDFNKNILTLKTSYNMDNLKNSNSFKNNKSNNKDNNIDKSINKKVDNKNNDIKNHIDEKIDKNIDDDNTNKNDINKNIEEKEILIDNNNDNINKEKIIQQKIKELNSEIIKFKEEKNKIFKLKSEYEKIQNKLMNDVKQFNLKKNEFEKYKKEELNKIKMEKKKIMSENKNINNIKFQNQSYAMMIKKDKETIENLKKQVLDYQFLLKQKESESKNKKNIKKLNIGNNKKIDDLNLDYLSQNNPYKKEKINEKKERRNHSSGSGKFAKNKKKIRKKFFAKNRWRCW